VTKLPAFYLINALSRNSFDIFTNIMQWEPFLETPVKNVTNVGQGFMVICEADQVLVSVVESISVP